MYLSETYEKKWQPVLEHPDLPKISDSYRRAVTATILENQERAQKEDAAFMTEAAPTNATGSGVSNWDPILISLVRRAMPNLIAYDIAGVQPMTGPTGLIFAMRSRFTSQTGNEALFDEADTDFSARNAAGDSTTGQEAGATGNEAGGHAGSNPALLNDSPAGSFQKGTAMTTATAEALGDDSSNNVFAEMAFSIEKSTVTAKSRALKAEYTMELAQDLKAIHGLDAETELSNICLLYTSPSPRDRTRSRMPSSA